MGAKSVDQTVFGFGSLGTCYWQRIRHEIQACNSATVFAALEAAGFVGFDGLSVVNVEVLHPLIMCLGAKVEVMWADRGKACEEEDGIMGSSVHSLVPCLSSAFRRSHGERI